MLCGILLSYFPQMLIREPIAHKSPEVNKNIFSSLPFIIGLAIPIIFGLIFLKVKSSHQRISKLGTLIGL